MPAATAIQLSDYSLVGKDTARAVERGLAEATWYASPVPKEQMRELLQRRDGVAIRDTIIWAALILGSASWIAFASGESTGFHLSDSILFLRSRLQALLQVNCRFVP